MNSPLLQLLVLAGIAVFLILRLKNVLGTRDGFEQTPQPRSAPAKKRPDFEVIDGGPDRDITDHVDEDSDAARALVAMKQADSNFNVAEFLQGARGAYEMILMGFERGDLAAIKPFLAEDVYAAFAEVVEAREAQGLTVEADFAGLREMALVDAGFDPETSEGEVTVKFIGELISTVRDRAGDIVEGGQQGKTKRQKDVWTFARIMGAPDPNWQLVATGE